MTLTKRRRILIALSVSVLALGVYLTSYFLVRRQRLSLEQAGKAMLFDSEEQVRQWTDTFIAKQHATPLMYSDSSLLYAIFWPVIQIDSAVSGRDIESPSFGRVEPYAVPQSSDTSRQSPGGDVRKAAPEGGRYG